MKTSKVHNNFQREQSRFFNKFVKDAKVINLSDETVAEKNELKEILKLIPNPRSKKILDVGCGTGRMSLRFALRCKQVVGIDISSQSIRLANKSAKKNKIYNFKGVVSRLEDLDYPHYFDCVILMSFLHHVDDIDSVFAGLRKVLKKGGICIIFEMNCLNPLLPFFMLWIGSVRSHLNRGYLRSNIYSLKKIIARNKFVIKKIHKYALLPTFLYNYSLVFRKINEILNKTPIVEQFCAFHVIQCLPNEKK